MIYNPLPSDIKFITKEAYNIIHGIGDLISKHTDNITFTINILENAARLCTVAKYVTIAKKWVKVPKTKPYDEWASSLSNFDVFFEKRVQGQGHKGLSTLYRNREDTAIYWDEKFWQIYMLCSKRLLMNWSSYHDMDTMVSWRNYDYDKIFKAFDVADKNNALSISYINAILQKDQLTIEHSHNKELEYITKCESSPLKKCERTIFDVLREMEIAEKAKLDYISRRNKEEIDKALSGIALEDI